VNKRELFSVCGKLVGHYPIVGWLRTACNFIKRTVNEVMWDMQIPPTSKEVTNDVLVRVSKDDTVKGKWKVSTDRGSMVWCDASCFSVGYCLQIDGGLWACNLDSSGN